MKSIFILGLLAIVGCSQTSQDLNQTSTNIETTTATKNTSQIQEAVAPSPQPTIQVVAPSPKVQTQVVAPALTQQVAPVPTQQNTSLIEKLRQQRDVKAVAPTVQALPVTQKIVAPSPTKKIPSADKLAANIRSSIGCGVVNEEYRTKVVAMAIAQTNKKATEKLTEAQFYQAVKQSIKENQAQANNLVVQFRTKNCSQARNTSSTVVKAPVPTGRVILEQAGNCKDLRARGISDINVKTNPWASKLDRDNDGIACETN